MQKLHNADVSIRNARENGMVASISAKTARLQKESSKEKKRNIEENEGEEESVKEKR